MIHFLYFFCLLCTFYLILFKSNELNEWMDEMNEGKMEIDECESEKEYRTDADKYGKSEFELNKCEEGEKKKREREKTVMTMIRPVPFPVRMYHETPPPLLSRLALVL